MSLEPQSLPSPGVSHNFPSPPPPQLFYGEGEEEGERGEERVRLTRLYQFARRVRALLHTYHYHQIFLTEFPGAYAKFTGRGLQPRSYGYGSLDDLLNAIPQVQN